MSGPSDDAIVEVVESSSVLVIPTVVAHAYWAEACRRYVALNRPRDEEGPRRRLPRSMRNHPSFGDGPSAS